MSNSTISQALAKLRTKYLIKLRAERAKLTGKLASIDEAIASTERAAGIIPLIARGNSDQIGDDVWL